MQSKMFVFIGFPQDYSVINLDTELEKLNQRFSNNDSLHFTRKDKLISADFDDVNFYISFPKSKTEISDWIQLAKDFELSIDLNATSREVLEKRYEESKKLMPMLYDDIHYSIAKDIFEEITKIPDVTVVTFQ